MVSSLMMLALLLAPTEPAAAAKARVALEGEYLEVRTCDVYTGPCFANAEVNEVGKEATVAWKFTAGDRDGVALDGKSVVAVIRNLNTLGKPRTEVKALETAIFVDSTATGAQQAALAAFAKERLGAYSTAEPSVRAVPIEMETGCCAKKGCAKMRAGTELAIDTRCVCELDKHCGNETLFYPPLTQGVEVIPAVATEHTVRTDLISVQFSDRESRGAMTGHFQVIADDTKSGTPTSQQADTDKKVAPASGTFELQSLDTEALPKEVPDAFQKVVGKQCLRLVGADKKPVYDLWLRSEIAFNDKVKPSLAIKFGQIPLGELVGVIRTYGGTKDFRDDAVKAGVFALRYAIQPENGNHMGTAPNRDFFLCTSFADDTSVDAISDMKKLGEMSIDAGGEHPICFHMRPVDGEAPKTATLRHDEEKNLWIADLVLAGKAGEKKEATKVRFGLVLIGVSESL